MNCAKALLKIIQNTPGGIVVYTTSVNDLCRDIFDETAVMVSPKRLADTYTEDGYYGEYERTRNNPRKQLLTIKS